MESYRQIRKWCCVGTKVETLVDLHGVNGSFFDKGTVCTIVSKPRSDSVDGLQIMYKEGEGDDERLYYAVVSHSSIAPVKN